MNGGAASFNRMAGISWECDICHAERPDEKISVHKADITPAKFPPGTVTRNVKYCNDNSACKAAAENWREERV